MRAGDVEIARRDLQTSTLQLQTKRNLFLGFGAGVDFLQRVGNRLLAARRRISCAAAPILRERFSVTPWRRLSFSRSPEMNGKINANTTPANASAIKRGDQKGPSRPVIKPSSILLSKRIAVARQRLPIQRARALSDRFRRSIRRDPRSAGGRCRSNGDGR